MEETKHIPNNDESIKGTSDENTTKLTKSEKSKMVNNFLRENSKRIKKMERAELRNMRIGLVFWLTIIVLLLHYFGFIDFFGWFNKINFLNNLGDEKTDGVIGTVYTEEEISYLPIMMGGIAGTAVIGGIGGGAYYFWPEEEEVVKKGWFLG